MEKLNIAVFFGGCSPEYSVSLESAAAVIRNMNQKKYRPIPIGITREGAWYYYTGDVGGIGEDTWHQRDADCIPAALSPNRGARALLLFKNDGVETLCIDAAFPVLHGQNGEDGTIQGLIALSGIPLVGCGVLASALCMDKHRAHMLASCAGIAVPKSRVFAKKDSLEAIQAFGRSLGYPLFVKPVRAGSSYGITCAAGEEALPRAVGHAFQYDGEIILEERIEGFEVGCAVMGRDAPIVGEVDEIELSGGFFDYTEKYTLKTSAIHVPARISEAAASRIKETAEVLYQTLGCSGFARVDMFLTPDGRIVFNEINTIPGFTEHSRFPGMMRAAGIPFPEILDAVIQEAMEQ